LIGPGQHLSREIALFISKDRVEIGSSLIHSVIQDGAAKGALGRDRHKRPIP
jgi:hypothetical protein